MLKYQPKIVISLFLILALLLTKADIVRADQQKLGIHLLHPQEINQVRDIFTDDAWRYVTIPLTLTDIKTGWSTWQQFFDQAAELHLIPIVRLTTSYDAESDSWRVPNRRQITDLVAFLSSLNWHQDEKLVIVFNEVNRAQEWGGRVDPLTYTRVLQFTSHWLHSEGLNYKVLPAALDLAAPNAADSMEAFAYLNRMYQIDPEVFDQLDYWNSHSYPNPGFASSPENFGQNSLRGFIYELNWLKNKTGRDLQVVISETGWSSSYLTNYYLDDYYLYALQHIWSNDQVKAVTPFVIKGSPGPFASFSFFDAGDQPTVQLFALKKALQEWQTE